MNPELWIVVPNWDKFQHYKDRDPVWIKQYNELVHRDDYLQLVPTARALLHGIWSLYALSDGQLRAESVGHALRFRATREHWVSLNDAGFIQLSASRPLALARSREKRREEKNKQALTRPKPKAPQTVDVRANASAYKTADRPPDIKVDKAMLELARSWLSP